VEPRTPFVPEDKRLSLLLDALAQVAISVELQPTLQILLDSLHHVVPFDAGGIFVLDGQRGGVSAQATRGYQADSKMPTTHGIVGEVVHTGRPRLERPATDDPAYLASRSSTAAQLTVPLASSRGVVGAVSLESYRPDAFRDEDLVFIRLFAQQAAVLVERALLHEQLMRQSRLEREIQIAREILRGLTPSALPTLPNLDVFGESLTAEYVGGDAFDFIGYPDGQLGISISDATGKGLPAALLAVAHQAMLHALVSMELRLRATFSRISELLARSVPSGHFVTNFYGVVDVSERRMVYVNAGHPPPLLVRATGQIEWLTVTAPVLAFPNAAPTRDAYVTFGQGDGLVLFTDGVTDAGPSSDQFFDLAGIETTVRSLWTRTSAEIGHGLLEAVKRHGGDILRDDATVVVVKFP
jgi:sigma-B regulation protein RsbU (phosphoserine phosphatase)